MSYKCYESTIEFKSVKVSGFGRNQQDSDCNALKSLFDNLSDKAEYITPLREALKQIKDQQKQELTAKDNKENLGNPGREGAHAGEKRPAQGKAALQPR